MDSLEKTEILSRESIANECVPDPTGYMRITTRWKIMKRVSKFVGFVYVNGVMCARHDHKIITTYETTSHLEAHHIHHSALPEFVVTPTGCVIGHMHGGQFPGMQVVSPAALGAQHVRELRGGASIDPAVLAGLRFPHVAMW